MAYDEKLLERIRAALKGRRDITEKYMFGGVAFLVGGRMSCGIQGSSLMLRLDPAEAEALVKAPGARAMDFTGRPMRGFLYVDASAISTAATLGKWVYRAIDYALAQPKKPARPAARERAARAATKTAPPAPTKTARPAATKAARPAKKKAVASGPGKSKTSARKRTA